MGVYLELENHTEMFMRAECEPIILNDMASSSVAEREKRDQQIMVKYEKTDLFSNEPHCPCGETHGGYKLKCICDNCGQEVREPFDQKLQPLVWMRSPHQVARLMNPVVWNILSKRFTKSNYNLIEWMCNTDYHPSGNKPLEIAELQVLGVERGYNNFVGNFNLYIDILLSLKHFRPKKGVEDDLKEMLAMYRDCIFSEYLPLPNKAMFIFEDTKVGAYVDPLVVGAVDAIHTICSIDTALSTLTVREKENRTAKTISMLAAFYHDVYSEIFSEKNGMYRKHIFGTRNHFSARAVISSNTRAHKYDTLEIAWGQAVTLFKVHLTNKLYKLNYTINQVQCLLQEYTVKYHPLLDHLFQEIIAESPGGLGVACIFARNPSLARGSTQRMYIIKVKSEDIKDPTISLSILAVKMYNADFDGKVLLSLNFFNCWKSL